MIPMHSHDKNLARAAKLDTASLELRVKGSFEVLFIGIVADRC
jgi:hypothetical protein